MKFPVSWRQREYSKQICFMDSERQTGGGGGGEEGQKKY